MQSIAALTGTFGGHVAGSVAISIYISVSYKKTVIDSKLAHRMLFTPVCKASVSRSSHDAPGVAETSQEANLPPWGIAGEPASSFPEMVRGF